MLSTSDFIALLKTDPTLVQAYRDGWAGTNSPKGDPAKSTDHRVRAWALGCDDHRAFVADRRLDARESDYRNDS